MKRLILTLSFFSVLFASLRADAQQAKAPLKKTFETLVGSWEGSLTYIDYGTGKPYTMPANIEVTEIAGRNQFAVSNIYPNEMSANSKDTIMISKDEKFIDKEMVKSVNRLKDGSVEIITEEKGTDGNDNKPAVFKHTYTFSKTNFVKRKDVQFVGETNWIKRHEYSYVRK